MLHSSIQAWIIGTFHVPLHSLACLKELRLSRAIFLVGAWTRVCTFRICSMEHHISRVISLVGAWTTVCTFQICSMEHHISRAIFLPGTCPLLRVSAECSMKHLSFRPTFALGENTIASIVFFKARIRGMVYSKEPGALVKR